MSTAPAASPSKRDARRVETTRRLRGCALELTRERGLDGWTMDDLALRADVSRRTVFNYFDTKVEVVLGPDHEIDEDAVATFVAGGPTGRLLDDVVVLASAAMHDSTIALEQAQLAKEVVLGDPQLFRLVHERFEAKTAQGVDHILRREGERFGAERARLLVQLLVTAFDHAVTTASVDEATPLEDALTAAIAEARALLSL